MEYRSDTQKEFVIQYNVNIQEQIIRLIIILSFQINYLFMKECVASNPVVPIQQQWLMSMLKCVPESLREGKDRKLLVEELFGEVTRDFEMSMKRCVGKCYKLHNLNI